MIGYYKLDLFDSPELTNPINAIYIPIIDKDEATELASQDVSYSAFDGYCKDLPITIQRGGYIPSLSFANIRYGDFGVYSSGSRGSMPQSPLQYTLLKTTLRDTFTKMFGPVLSGDLSLDKFNMARLSTYALTEPYTQKLYFKNGKYLEVTREENERNITGIITAYNSSGGKINTTPLRAILAIKQGGISGFNTLLSNNTVQGLIEAGIITGSNDNNSGFYFCPFLFSDMTGVSYSSKTFYTNTINNVKFDSNSRRCYREAFGTSEWYEYYGLGSFSLYLGEFFTQVLGFNGNRTVEENFATLDAEYEEWNDDPDADNTYPGGGNDQNQYPEDGTSGKGTFDNRNDPIDFPDMPVWDATSTGFISMWNPTISEISALYGFLWDSDISTTLKKLFLEPMEAVISLAFFPVEPTNFPNKRNVTIGHVDTGIQMNAVQKQFVDFDFGDIEVDEYYGAAWDYSPYTHASIYLPYIGVQAIDIDDVMKGSLHLKYRIDLLSGMCSAMLKIDRSRDGLGAIIYTWQGNCAMFVPVTAGSAREFINSIIQIGAMAGVAMAQPAAGAIEARANRDVEDYKAPSLGGNWINPAMSAYSTLNVLGQKVHVQRGGRVDSNAGVMSPQQAYIILSRPVSAIPKGWNKYAGYPSLKIKKLSTQKGYTEIAYIKLNNLEATAEEISELNSILRGGVIL